MPRWREAIIPLALVAGTALATSPALAQQCTGSSSDEAPYPEYSILIGSTVSCDSVSTADPDAPSYEGCSIPIADLEAGSASCTVVFGDSRDPITVEASIDAEGLLSFATSDGLATVKIVNTEGATGGNNCGFGFGAGTDAGVGLGHIKSNGQVTGLRSANFCTDGIAAEEAVPIVKEADFADCSDLITVPDGHLAFLLDAFDLTYEGACFGDNIVAGERIVNQVCLDRCEPCDDGDDPQRCEHRALEELSGLDCELSGNWGYPDGIAAPDWEPRAGVEDPYCWEVFSAPNYDPEADFNQTITWRRTQFQRASFDFQAGPATTTNPRCISYFSGGTQRVLCY